MAGSDGDLYEFDYRSNENAWYSFFLFTLVHLFTVLYSFLNDQVWRRNQMHKSESHYKQTSNTSSVFPQVLHSFDWDCCVVTILLSFLSLLNLVIVVLLFEGLANQILSLISPSIGVEIFSTHSQNVPQLQFMIWESMETPLLKSVLHQTFQDKQ